MLPTRDKRKRDLEKVAEIEKALLIAPFRDFRDEGMRGYFDHELTEKFGATHDQFKIMIHEKRSTFKMHHKTNKHGAVAMFFTLR